MEPFQQATNNISRKDKSHTLNSKDDNSSNTKPDSKEKIQNAAKALLLIASFPSIANAEDGPKIEPISNTQNNVQVENNAPQITIPSLPSKENLPTYSSAREDYRKALSESSSQVNTKNDSSNAEIRTTQNINDQAMKLNEENVIKVNDYLSVGIDESRNKVISNVKIKADGIEKVITGYIEKNGKPYYLDENGVRAHGLVVRNNGAATYNTIDKKGCYIRHKLTANGKYSEKPVGMDIAHIQPIVFTEFRTDQANVTNTNISGETKTKVLTEGITIAKNEHRMPVIYSGYHGSIGWNRGTGDDSQFIQEVGLIAKEVGYEGSIGILFMHCFSGALEKERLACEKYLPVGSCVLKTSRPVSYTYYNPNTIQSSKPKERDESCFIISGIHLGSNIIVESNEVNGIVVTNNGAKIYNESEDGNSVDLPFINNDELEDYLYNELLLPKDVIPAILASGNCKAYLRFMLEACSEFEKSSSYNGWYKPIGFDHN